MDLRKTTAPLLFKGLKLLQETSGRRQTRHLLCGIVFVHFLKFRRPNEEEMFLVCRSQLKLVKA